MDIELKEKVRIFSDVNNDFRKNFRWDGKEINCLASLITGSSLEGFDEKNMKAIRKFIRKNKKAFASICLLIYLQSLNT